MKKAFAAFLVLCMIMTVFSASAGCAGAEPDPGQQEQAAGDDGAEEKDRLEVRFFQAEGAGIRRHV